MAKKDRLTPEEQARAKVILHRDIRKNRCNVPNVIV